MEMIKPNIAPNIVPWEGEDTEIQKYMQYILQHKENSLRVSLDFGYKIKGKIGKFVYTSKISTR